MKNLKTRIAKIEFETTPRSFILTLVLFVVLIIAIQPLMDTDWSFISKEKQEMNLPVYGVLYLAIFTSIYKVIQTIVLGIVFFWLGQRYERKHGKNRARKTI